MGHFVAHRQESKELISRKLIQTTSDPIFMELRRKNREKMRRWRAKNPERTAELTKKWRSLNKHKVRDNNLRMRFGGFRLADWAELFEKQNGLCALCDRSSELVTDHSHETGKVRGLLCKGCNTALGGFEVFVRKGLMQKVLSYIGER